MKAKLIGISLLFSLFAPVAATFVYLQYQKKQIKREVKWNMIAGIDRDELVLLTFSKEETETELRWKHSREFEYKGEMYDIVEKTVGRDSVSYWCWWDHEETALNRQLDGLLARVMGQNPERQKNQAQLSQFFKNLYFQEVQEESVEMESLDKTTFFYANRFQSIGLSPPIPPPRQG